MSIATHVDFFLHVGHQDARGDSVVRMPKSTVLHTVLRLTLHMCMRVFSLLRTLWLATRVHRFQGWPVLTHHGPLFASERGRFCGLDRMSWTVNIQSELKTVCFVRMENGVLS